MATKKAPPKGAVKKAPVKQAPVQKIQKKGSDEVLSELTEVMKDVRDFLRELSIYMEKEIQAKAVPEVVEVKEQVKTKKTDSDESPEAMLTGIRQLIQQKVDEGKTAKVVSLLNKFGVQNASSLDESDYEDFSEKLKSL